MEKEHPVTEAQTVLSAVAQGDLTQQLRVSAKTEITTLLTTLTTVRADTESVSAHPEQITRSNEDLSQRTAE